MSEGVSEVSERMNERTAEQVALYFHLDFWLFWPTVQRRWNHYGSAPSQQTQSSGGAAKETLGAHGGQHDGDCSVSGSVNGGG